MTELFAEIIKKRQPHKMVKHTQTIRRFLADELIDYFVGLALKGLTVDWFLYDRDPLYNILPAGIRSSF